VTDPIPTKLDDTDGAWLELLAKRTGLKKSEIIRRAVRTLATAVAENPKLNWIGDTSRAMPPLSAEQQAEIDDHGPKTFEDANARAKKNSDADRKSARRQTRS
jgi:hypothetical protein